MAYNPKFFLPNGTNKKTLASVNYVSNQLEYNLRDFIDYGILSAGGFVNVKRNRNNIHGNSPDRLYPVQDPNYKNGQIWQTMRKNWVYETGIGGGYTFTGSLASNDGSLPAYITGIKVNDTTTINTSTTGTYDHSLDYLNGRVIFDSAISMTTKLNLDYSYKWVQVYTYSDAEWWQEIQYATDENAKHHKSKDKGDFFVDPKNRVQLPAVVIEIIPRSSSTPYRLGDHSMVLDQDILIHVVADNYFDRNNICDMIRLQEDRIIKLYDINTVSKSGVYPYKMDGTLNPTRIQYDDLVNNDTYYYNNCRLKNMVVSTVESVNPDLFESTIRTTAEIIIT